MLSLLIAFALTNVYLPVTVSTRQLYLLMTLVLRQLHFNAAAAGKINFVVCQTPNLTHKICKTISYLLHLRVIDLFITKQIDFYSDSLSVLLLECCCLKIHSASFSTKFIFIDF